MKRKESGGWSDKPTFHLVKESGKTSSPSCRSFDLCADTICKTTPTTLLSSPPPTLHHDQGHGETATHRHDIDDGLSFDGCDWNSGSKVTRLCLYRSVLLIAICA